MIITCPKEITAHETRVAITPETAAKYIGWGYQVHIEKNAGKASGFKDADYQKVGAKIVDNAYEGASIILKIWAPLQEEEKFLHAEQIIIANFQALSQKERIKAWAEKGLTCFALDLMPRISRAQSMDILSSQSNLAGYKAVIEAINQLGKAVPLMMTAAGTIAPAKVLILGAGVAGLQAIATAKRLGAMVFASDVRPQVKEQVESLGGKFLEVKTDEVFETSGGYAKETSEDYKQKQQQAVAEQLTKTDIAITTALIPGRPAPRLITKEMLAAMPEGSIVIDMAAASGGNVEGSIENETIEFCGTKIIGASNLAIGVPHSASALFAKNIYNFLSPMYKSEAKEIKFNFDDELINGTCICKNGQVLKGA